MGTVERRHREAALACFFRDRVVPVWVGGWCNNGAFPPLDAKQARWWQRVTRVAQSLADLEAHTTASLAPVTGDRLLAALACHIDHDAPPGMAARELATAVLELLDGLPAMTAVVLVGRIHELKAERRLDEPADWSKT